MTFGKKYSWIGILFAREKRVSVSFLLETKFAEDKFAKKTNNRSVDPRFEEGRNLAKISNDNA